MGGALSNLGDSQAEREEEAEKFVDQSVRHAFMRKVFFIFFMQLIATAALMYAMTTSEKLQQMVAENVYLLWVALGVTCFVSIAISCCEKAAHTTPLNYILLGLFTLAEGFLLGVLCIRYDPQTILMALGLTAAISFVCILFALQTKIDFTACCGMIIVLAVCILVGSILMIFIKNRIMTIVFAIFGVAAYSFFLMYDIQLMMIGEHAYSFSPDDYVVAALHLYVDIVMILVCLLKLFEDED